MIKVNEMKTFIEWWHDINSSDIYCKDEITFQDVEDYTEIGYKGGQEASKLEITQLRNAFTNFRLKDAGEWCRLKENLKRFEAYSYYVGAEVTCKRMPMKYSAWLAKFIGDTHGTYIGLCDKNSKDIHSGDTIKCKVEKLYTDAPEELVGVIRWAKYKAGYTLQNGEQTIAAFRCITGFGVAKIKELPDGRIDGEVISERNCTNKLLEERQKMVDEDFKMTVDGTNWTDTSKLKLSKEQLEILNHTIYRSGNGFYCGDSEDMQALVILKLMKSAGRGYSSCPEYPIIVQQIGYGGN